MLLLLTNKEKFSGFDILLTEGTSRGLGSSGLKGQTSVSHDACSLPSTAPDIYNPALVVAAAVDADGKKVKTWGSSWMYCANVAVETDEAMAE